MRAAEAHAGAAAPPRRVIALTPAEAEVGRQMQICNACRYCEGYCAVFPAMTRRLVFDPPDIHYLANLCHQCGACYHACQYAPPHEFGVNVPRAMAAVRADTYRTYAWPAALGALYRRNGLTVAVALAGALAACLAVVAALGGGLRREGLAGQFYAVWPHGLLVALFGAVAAWAALALGIGVTRFWRGVRPGDATVPAVREAAVDVLTLTYLGGGHGDGCNEADDRYTPARRWFHHATFYGFLACFAATAVATLDHYLWAREAPYPLLSAPVVLGTVGGLGLLVGPAGLLWLNLRRDPQVGDAAQRPMDRAFIALLLLTSGSGLALLAGRTSAQMPGLLAVHLGIVLALFATLPYGKFAHGLYRAAALLKSSIEKRQPNRLRLGDE